MERIVRFIVLLIVLLGLVRCDVDDKTVTPDPFNAPISTPTPEE